MPSSAFDPRSILFVSLLVVAGCDDVDPELEPAFPGDIELRTTRSEVATKGDPDGGGWISNGLDDPDVSGVDPSYGLSTDDGLATDEGMLVDLTRRDTAKYMVECALEPGQSVTKVVGSETLVLEGLVGLAPEWEDDACDEDCQQWVSACLLARTNASGQTVKLWLKADHPAVGTKGNVLYPIYEASFFGNLFADPDEQYICQGNVAGTTVAFLEGRTCSSELGGSCGFTKYTDCGLQPRCTFTGLLSPTAIDCVPSGGTSRHTISTYISPL